MRTLGLLTVVSLVAACRIGFPEQPDGAPPSDAPPDAPPTVLTCGTQTQFPIGTPTRMSATATPDGYNVVTLDSAGDVHASSYGFTSTNLVRRQADVFVTGSTTGALGVLAAGDHTLLSAPRIDGTTLIELDASLKTVGTPANHNTWQGGAGTLAQTRSGAVAFVAASMMSGDVETRMVMVNGAPTGAIHTVAPGSQQPSLPTLVPAGDDLLVVWGRTVPKPDQADVAVLSVVGGQFMTKIPTTAISPAIADEADNPRGAYAATLGIFLVSWMRKTNMGDQIWGSLRHADMTPIGSPFQIGAQGNFPIVAASDTDFLVVWKDGPTQLYAARVSPQGTVKLVNVSNASTVADWDVVVRAGQPALTWVSANTDGSATLWFDPLCN